MFVIVGVLSFATVLLLTVGDDERAGDRSRRRVRRRRRARNRAVQRWSMLAIVIVAAGVWQRGNAVKWRRGAASSRAQIVARGQEAQFALADLPSSGASKPSVGGPILPADCDVVVVGATPAGIAAALAAARRGAQVLVLEERAHAGGDVTYAMLNMFDVVARPGEASPAHGIFAEFFDQLGLAYDIDTAQKLFENSLREQPNIRFVPNTRVIGTYKSGNRITGLQVKPNGDAPTRVLCRVVVDATNDASVAVRGGAQFYLGREDVNRDKAMQSAGLLFSLRKVNWEKVRDYVRGRRLADAGTVSQHGIDVVPKTRAQFLALNSAGPRVLSARGKSASPKVWVRLGGARGGYAWERGDITKPYRPHGRDIMLLSINFGRQHDGSVVLNTLNIVGVNGLSAASRSAARAQAIAELPYLLPYLRKTMPGLEHATLGRIAPELYIRETRHIHGLITLKAEDIRGEKRFFDRIARVAYPLDLHPYFKGDRNPYGPRRYLYTMPLRALIPRSVDGVFVASRSLSATYSAAGSARVIPVTMACGEAAGAAAWLCSTTGKTPQQLATDYPLIARLQSSLQQHGADIGNP